MGVQVGCCGCSKRMAIMIVAVVWALSALLASSTIIAVGQDHEGHWFQTWPYFHTLIGMLIFMLIVSILLWIGAYYNIFWFCLPWLFVTIVNLLISIIQTIKDLRFIRADALLLMGLYYIVLIYVYWIVASFVYELIKSRSSGGDEENRPLIRNN